MRCCACKSSSPLNGSLTLYSSSFSGAFFSVSIPAVHACFQPVFWPSPLSFRLKECFAGLGHHSLVPLSSCGPQPLWHCGRSSSAMVWTKQYLVRTPETREGRYLTLYIICSGFPWLLPSGTLFTFFGHWLWCKKLVPLFSILLRMQGDPWAVEDEWAQLPGGLQSLSQGKIESRLHKFPFSNIPLFYFHFL